MENGQEISPLNVNDGQGNFYMKPNGVFLINELMDTVEYADGGRMVKMSKTLSAEGDAGATVQ